MHGFFCVVQEIWRTQAAQTFGETTEDSADFVNGQHLIISDDIWYLTDVGHGSDMWYTFRQKTIFELGSGYLRGKNVDELKHCPRKYNTGLTDSSVELFW